MRQIGTIRQASLAEKFSSFLSAQKIDNSIDATFDPKEEKASYAIWVHDEDQLQKAQELLARFEKDPAAQEFDHPKTAATAVSAEIAFAEEEQKRIYPKMTVVWIFLCVLAFFLNAMQEASIRKQEKIEAGFIMTPIRFAMLYDIPPTLDKDEITQEEMLQAPYWRGVAPWVASKILGEPIPDLGEKSIFYKIRQGQIWRLFSPSLLHAGLLHIAFNMLWLWALGKEIDLRIGLFRSLLLTLSTGVVSNTVQYLMGGPFFLGYSGIVTGLAGFIWSRQKIAPWEGYPLKRSMLLFLALFVIGMLLVQLGSFAIMFFTGQHFFSGIANSAHISGALWGLFLGRLSFFSARGSRA